MTLMLTPTQRGHILRKLDGWDDHELVSMRAGDVRALLIEIEALLPPRPITIPHSAMAELEKTMRCQGAMEIEGKLIRCTLSAVHEVIPGKQGHRFDVSRGDEGPRA